MASKPIVKTEDGGWKIVDRPPTARSLAEIIDKTLVGDQKKESERRPRSPTTHRGRLENFVGEEAPEAGTSASLGINFRTPQPAKPVRRPERS